MPKTRFDKTARDPLKELVLGRKSTLQLSEVNLAAKMGFDCTYPVPKPESYTLVSFQDVDIGKYDIG